MSKDTFTNKILFVWDFDGVLACSMYEPLTSSYASFGLTPSKNEIKYYLNCKKDIHNVRTLQNKLCKLRDVFDIHPKVFQQKLFNYRNQNKNNIEYVKQFKPTLLAKFLKFFSNFNDCIVLTSRDRETVEKFLLGNHIQAKKIFSTANEDLKKSEYLNKLLCSRKKIIFLDDMPINFEGMNRNIKAIKVVNYDNKILNSSRKIFEIFCIFTYSFLS